MPGGLFTFMVKFSPVSRTYYEVRAMTAEKAKTLSELQQRGWGYKKIAALMNLPVNTVKAYCRRHKAVAPVAEESQAFCRNCGKPISRIPKAKPRQFCSDACRMQFWSSHRDEGKPKAIYRFHCPYCGREFQSIGNPHRKYCSRECVANARRKGGASDGA